MDTNMATKTLSASLDPETYQAAQRAAGEERRSQSYVVSEALRLYTALPLEIRQLLSRVEQQEAGDGEGKGVAENISRAIRRAILTSALDGLAARIPPLDANESEIDGLADEAVKWTRKRPSD